MWGSLHRFVYVDYICLYSIHWIFFKKNIKYMLIYLQTILFIYSTLHVYIWNIFMKNCYIFQKLSHKTSLLYTVQRSLMPILIDVTSALDLLMCCLPRQYVKLKWCTQLAFYTCGVLIAISYWSGYSSLLQHHTWQMINSGLTTTWILHSNQVTFILWISSCPAGPWVGL